MAEPEHRQVLKPATNDRRTRIIEGDGLHWEVREKPWPTADRRSGSTLVFDAEMIVRCVRTFPPDWYEWSDSDLYQLSLRT